MEISMIEFEPIDELAADSSGDLKDLLASWLARKIILEGHKKVVDRKLEVVTEKVDALVALIGNPFVGYGVRDLLRASIWQLQKAVKKRYDTPDGVGSYHVGSPYGYLHTMMSENFPVTHEEIIKHAEKIVDMLSEEKILDPVAFRLRVEFDDDVDAFLEKYADLVGLVKLAEAGADV